ncbi:MAG TPA: glutathione S-transferase family protein [Spongiibacteraceae bacterium]|nr:glutathione S-transferase [Spongiibacteraceae bacterium]HCS29678.1 glutathione S-transferase family protein [Spongiibacteraceae bacterium]|tara:strand:+ start:1138 stop:1797 length:660 start_codon:yes stop_codon:yes gene_type:complete
MAITLYGAHISPFVRKVRAALAYKGLPYDIVFVAPKMGEQPAEFKANSPLGKIPLLRDGDLYIPDSSVICAWLDRQYPNKPLLPSDNVDAVRALWFEEYAGSVMTTAMGGHLFAEVVLAKLLFNRESLQSDIDKAINEEIPAIFDYLESQIAGDYLLASGFSLADIAVGSISVAMLHSDYHCDAARWPKTATYLKRLFEGEVFAPLIADEKALLASFGG